LVLDLDHVSWLARFSRSGFIHGNDTELAFLAFNQIRDGTLQTFDRLLEYGFKVLRTLWSLLNDVTLDFTTSIVDWFSP
jgi:hypothetical protein